MSTTSLSLEPENLSRLVSLCYEAPLHPGPGAAGQPEREAWRNFASEAAGALDCQLALVEYQDAKHPERNFIAASGLDGFEEVFTSARTRDDEDSYLIGMRQRPTGAVQLGTDLVAADDMHRSSYYSALALPWQLEYFLMANISTAPGGGAFFALGRTAGADPFVAGDKAVVGKLLLPHLTRSMTVQKELTAIREVNAVLAGAMHEARTGLIVFDQRGRPVLVNQKAAEIFARGDGLALVNGGLHADRSVGQAQLTHALLAVLHGARGWPVPAPATVLVARAASPHPYRVTFSMLRPPGAGAGLPCGSAVVALIHDDPPAGGGTVPALLRATYGLTRAEVSLCDALLTGLSLGDAAIELGVSRNTAKTHLARVFDKTGVRSQIALLRLLTLGSRT